MAKLLRARLQYAQLKITTGMSTENLQQIEQAFISAPRQPRRPLRSEYPPTPAHSSPHSRKLKRMLLSAMTPTQSSWRKKKKIREQRKNEAIEDEVAARTILLLSSSSSSQNPDLITPPNSEHRSDNSKVQHYQPPAYYDDKDNASSLYDAVADISDYEERSREICQLLPKKRQPEDHSVFPPAIVHGRNQETGNPYQYFEYNRPLPPPPPQYHYKPKHPFMFDCPLVEDPFNSKPIGQNQLSSRDNSPPSP